MAAPLWIIAICAVLFIAYHVNRIYHLYRTMKDLGLLPSQQDEGGDK